MKKVIQALNANFESHLMVLSLAVMSVVIFVQVIARYVFHHSLSWSEELARYVFIWLTYLAISYGVKVNAHIRVDAVMLLLPKRLRRPMRILAEIIFLVFSVLVVYYGWKTSVYILSTSQHSPAIGIPMGVVYMAVPVGFTLTSIRLIQGIVKKIRNEEEEEGGQPL